MSLPQPFNTTWSPSFAYALGLMVSDGCLSKDGRHLVFTSKDIELVRTIKECLGVSVSICRKSRSTEKIKRYYYVQFGSRIYYDWLMSVGLTPAKSKTIGPVKVPDKYFADFLRGCIDGDGCISVHKHPESIHPQLRVRLTSASKSFLTWVFYTISERFRVQGGFIRQCPRAFELTFCKSDSIIILNRIYYPGVKHYLDRKYQRAVPYLYA